MSRWVGFIDLLALRHAASIDQNAVERLLSNFFEIIRSFAQTYSAEQMTVDILSDSAVLRFVDFDIMREFYLKIRPEMILKETYYRLGISAGDVDIERFNFKDHSNIAGTYFRGAAGMAAYAAQNTLNGAGAIFVPPANSKRSTDTREAAAAFSSALDNGAVITSYHFSRDQKPQVDSYYDFAMSEAEIGYRLNLNEDESLTDLLSQQDDNDGFIFFDEVYAKYAYTRGLDRFIARKYLSVFFTLIASTDLTKSSISEDGKEFSNLPVSFCRMFFDGRFKGIERDEDFSLILLHALGKLIDLKTRGDVGELRIAKLLDEVAELKWVCKILVARKVLYKRLGGVSDKLVSMRTKDIILRGMTELGYLY